MTHDASAQPEETTSFGSSFPGGAVRLPRISRPAHDPGDEMMPDVLFVDSAFLRPDHAAPPAEEGQGFAAYNSTDSLFDTEAHEELEADVDAGPFRLLGVTVDMSWPDICKAHRQLVSELHPDRFVDAEDEVREAAERRVRDVNEAFAQIRRERAVSTR